jgi:hypothetical protein
MALPHSNEIRATQPRWSARRVRAVTSGGNGALMLHTQPGRGGNGCAAVTGLGTGPAHVGQIRRVKEQPDRAKSRLVIVAIACGGLY